MERWTVVAGPDAGTEPAYPSLVVGLRGALYALPQTGNAVLLPWLQRFRRPTALPAAPEWVAGLVGVRGTAHLVIDLGSLLGLGAFQTADATRLVFLEWGEYQAGFVVDEEVGMRYMTPPAKETSLEPVIGEAVLDGRTVKIVNTSFVLSRLESALNDTDRVSDHQW